MGSINEKKRITDYMKNRNKTSKMALNDPTFSLVIFAYEIVTVSFTAECFSKYLLYIQ